MTRLQLPRRTRAPRDEAPKESAEPALEEWFTRRLESQGIPARIGRQPRGRILAVTGLVVAVLGLVWAFSSATSSRSDSSAPAVSTPAVDGTTDGGQSDPGTGSQGNGQGSGATVPPAWNEIPVDVLNGFGGGGAAGTAAAELTAQGWRVRSTADAGTATTQTVVIYAPGFKKQAQVVTRKLGLGAPIPEAEATGVPAGSTQGVAILVGPDLLPAA